MEKITFCIPSKSNLRYLKTCIPSIRNNAYRKDHEIIIFVDSDEDGTVEWLEQVKDEYTLSYYVNPKLGEELYGIGRAYDFCIEKSTTDIFMIFHADMILGKNADFEAYKHMIHGSKMIAKQPQYKTVCSLTRIEPPLHPNNGEKILLDCGMYPEEFKEKEFTIKVLDQLYKNDTSTTEGIFAPWMMYKKEYLEILGGHDPILHSCREDSDIFNRMLLSGFKFIQTWEGFVYHFTGRGAGSFDGDKQRHEFWQQQMNNSTRDFIRKWGTNVSHTPMMKPIVYPKYEVGFVVENCYIQLIHALEPWCDYIYVDLEEFVLYSESEQKNSSFDIDERVRGFDPNKHVIKDNITVKIDGDKFTQQDFQILQQLSAIIQDSGEIGEFELGNLKIQINDLTTYENEFIKHEKETKRISV
jgi:glycosyltransferase involved in cell wall biosynthesis